MIGQKTITANWKKVTPPTWMAAEAETDVFDGENYCRYKWTVTCLTRQLVKEYLYLWMLCVVKEEKNERSFIFPFFFSLPLLCIDMYTIHRHRYCIFECIVVGVCMWICVIYLFIYFSHWFFVPLTISKILFCLEKKKIK